jgi:hypothetical protein
LFSLHALVDPLIRSIILQHTSTMTPVGDYQKEIQEGFAAGSSSGENKKKKSAKQRSATREEEASKQTAASSEAGSEQEGSEDEVPSSSSPMTRKQRMELQRAQVAKEIEIENQEMQDQKSRDTLDDSIISQSGVIPQGKEGDVGNVKVEKDSDTKDSSLVHGHLESSGPRPMDNIVESYVPSSMAPAGAAIGGLRSSHENRQDVRFPFVSEDHQEIPVMDVPLDGGEFPKVTATESDDPTSTAMVCAASGLNRSNNDQGFPFASEDPMEHPESPVMDVPLDGGEFPKHVPPIEAGTFYESKKTLGRKKVVVALSLIALLVIIGIIVGTTAKKDGAPASTDAGGENGSPVAPQPGSTPGTASDIIRGVALGDGSELDDATTYQAKSLAWIESNDNTQFSVQKLIQRYVLGCIYYATHQISTLATADFYGQGQPVLEWADSSGWITNDDECNWYGIACDGDGIITDIELDENNLSGTWPDEIILLKDSLISLDISNNPIQNVYDELLWLGELVNLEYLL